MKRILLLIGLFVSVIGYSQDIGNISNGESGLSVRGKINQAIDTTNRLNDTIKKYKDQLVNIEANTAKISYTDASDVGLNTTHRSSDGSDHSDVVANTAKVTNATHTGEVTGATALTIASNVIEAANMESTNSPTDDYVWSYDASSGGGTWVENAGGGGGGDLTASDTLTIISAKHPVDSLKEALGNTIDPEDVFVAIDDTLPGGERYTQRQVDSIIDELPASGGGGASYAQTLYGKIGATANADPDSITHAALDTMDILFAVINDTVYNDSSNRYTHTDSVWTFTPPLANDDVFFAALMRTVTPLALQDTTSSGGGGDNGLLTNLVTLCKLNDSSAPITDSHGDLLIPSDSIDGVTYGVTGGPSNLGNAISFDGTSSSYVRPNDVGDALQLTEFSVSVWVKGTSSSDYYLRYSNSGAGWELYSNSSGITYSRLRTSPFSSIESDQDDMDDAWHHIVITYDQVDYLMYVDGELQTSQASATLVPTYVGARFEWGNVDNTSAYNGSMLQFGVWSEALSSTKVSDLYNDGDGLDYDDFTDE